MKLEIGNVGVEEAVRDSIHENEAVQSTTEKQSLEDSHGRVHQRWKFTIHMVMVQAKII